MFPLGSFAMCVLPSKPAYQVPGTVLVPGISRMNKPPRISKVSKARTRGGEKNHISDYFTCDVTTMGVYTKYDECRGRKSGEEVPKDDTPCPGCHRRKRMNDKLVMGRRVSS